MVVSVALLHEHALLKGRRILIAEDEYFLGDDIERTLRALGAEVVGPIGEIPEMLSILNDGRTLDGAVLDVNIRGETIFPVARELQARGVPFLLTTGYDKLALPAELKDIPLWEKPIDVMAMARALAGLMERRGPATGSGADPKAPAAS